MCPCVHQSGSESVLLFSQLDWVSIKLSELVLQRLKFFLDIFLVVHKLLPKICILLKLMKILGLWGQICLWSNEQIMQRFQLMHTPFLKIGHEHILPQNNDLT